MPAKNGLPYLILDFLINHYQKASFDDILDTLPRRFSNDEIRKAVERLNYEGYINLKNSIYAMTGEGRQKYFKKRGFILGMF